MSQFLFANWCAICTWVVVVPMASAQESADVAGKKRSLRNSEEFGLTFCYTEQKEIEAFLTSTPCASGRWRFRKQDDKHWIGDLLWATENTVDYDKNPDLYFHATKLAIRKQEGLPIDLKKFRGVLVLRDPRPDVPLSRVGDGTPYELVGFHDGKLKARKRFAYKALFARNPKLKYEPPK